MLKTLSRALTVALLILTVPVQGVAAVSAGICMALGHHDGEAAAHGHDSGGEAQNHDHGTAADHHHDDGAASGNSHGTHCAPCVAVAITSFSPAVLPEFGASPLVPARLVSFRGVPPHRLDRPPLAL